MLSCVMSKYKTREEIQARLDQIECELSPENLSWDGERPAAQVRIAAARLMKEKRELNAKLIGLK